MDTKQEKNWIRDVSLMIIALVCLGFILHYAQAVLIPFVLAIFITQLVSPVLDYQVLKFKIPRSIAVAITLLLVFVVIAFLSIFTVNAIQTVIATAGRYSSSFISFTENVLAKLQTWKINVDQPKLIEQLQGKIPALLTNTFGTVVGFSSSTVLVCIFVIFLLIGRNPRVVRSGIYAEIDSDVRRYIATKAVISIITGTLVWLTLMLFGLELAAVFGMLAFLLNFIPSVGSIVATLLPLPIAFAQFDNIWMVVLVVAVPGAIQMTIGNVIEPKILGRGLQLHPVTILLALSFWGLLWGFIGMFLAVPLTAVIRITMMQFETFRPVAQLLAGQLPKFEPEPHS